MNSNSSTNINNYDKVFKSMLILMKSDRNNKVNVVNMHDGDSLNVPCAPYVFNNNDNSSSNNNSNNNNTAINSTKEEDD